MIDIVNRLRFDAVRCETQFSKGVAGNINEAADEIERLRAPFKHADEADWDYLERLLIVSVKHQQDSQPRFWLEAMKEARRAYQQQMKTEG